MKKNQCIVHFTNDSEYNFPVAIIPEKVDLKTISIYKLPPWQDDTLPKAIRYGETIFLIDCGHDYRYTAERIISSSNPDINSGRLLVEWGEEVLPVCSKCKESSIHTNAQFCMHCGEKLHNS